MGMEADHSRRLTDHCQPVSKTLLQQDDIALLLGDDLREAVNLFALGVRHGAKVEGAHAQSRRHYSISCQW